MKDRPRLEDNTIARLITMHRDGLANKLRFGNHTDLCHVDVTGVSLLFSFFYLKELNLEPSTTKVTVRIF